MVSSRESGKDPGRTSDRSGLVNGCFAQHGSAVNSNCRNRSALGDFAGQGMAYIL